jgi:hypothetical protein
MGMDDKQKRWLVIGLLGVAVLLATLLFSGPNIPAPAVLPPQPPQTPAAATKHSPPLLPNGAAKAALPTRDIFAPPAEFAALRPPVGNGATRNGGVGPRATAGPAPVLTGVIEGSNGRRVAILRQGNISRSYRVGESAGAYRVAAIGARSVTLAGPGGTRVLTMGQ